MDPDLLVLKKVYILNSFFRKTVGMYVGGISVCLISVLKKDKIVNVLEAFVCVCVCVYVCMCM